MNLARYLTGCVKALGRGDSWEAYFDLSRKGFKQSFVALALSLPFYYVCAEGVRQHQAGLSGEAVSALPAGAFFLIFTHYAATFVVTAYIIAMVFDKQDCFRPWVIVRHWAIFFAALFAALLMGLYMVGVLPFLLSVYMVFGIYLFTLVIDIRLAARIPGFEWGAAILTGCLITAMGLTILMIGVSQFVR